MRAALATRFGDPRKAAEARLEQLHDAMLSIIAALDTMDGDPDLEPSICGGINPDRSDVTDDREGGDVLDEGEPNDWDGEDNGDNEPSLGRSNPDPGPLPPGWFYSAFHGGDADV
ncbi:hypothetical protein [Devosia sp. CN2-171]|uniref:hypothetical protein n=1 Tax=Devosia sp. CN2-171 TaxID=3400909 RepID=UPI003BF9091C